jgi:hypothetical protein
MAGMARVIFGKFFKERDLCHPAGTLIMIGKS